MWAGTFRETGDAQKPTCYISAGVTARTFLALVRRVLDGDLFLRIKEDFERQSVQWQQPLDPDLLDQSPRGLPAPQLALTHQP